MKRRTDSLVFQGLDLAPSQEFGAFRLTPVLRREPRSDLRLARRGYNAARTLVELPDGTDYWSFIPHGLILSWTSDGSAVAAFGSGLDKGDGRDVYWRCSEIRLLPKMARRLSGNRLRFLPLHLAMEGFLAMHFNGPDVAWGEYSLQAFRDGLSPRSESVVAGNELPGFDEALRIFEIHDRQVGMLVSVAGALASAFVVPTPDDYRQLHTTLLEDFFCDLIAQYALFYSGSKPLRLAIDDEDVRSLDDLEEAIRKMRNEWAAYDSSRLVTDNLMERDLHFESIYQAGPFRLQRFVTDLDPALVNHIGEAIIRENGDVEYLKSFRLSGAQTRRAYLLSQLAKYDWHIGDTAAAFGQEPHEFLLRLKNAGFGYLIAQHVMDAAHAKDRRRRSGKG